MLSRACPDRDRLRRTRLVLSSLVGSCDSLFVGGSLGSSSLLLGFSLSLSSGMPRLFGSRSLFASRLVPLGLFLGFVELGKAILFGLFLGESVLVCLFLGDPFLFSLVFRSLFFPVFAFLLLDLLVLGLLLATGLVDSFLSLAFSLFLAFSLLLLSLLSLGVLSGSFFSRCLLDRFATCSLLFSLLLPLAFKLCSLVLGYALFLGYGGITCSLFGIGAFLLLPDYISTANTC
jgi:hypothetical protein